MNDDPSALYQIIEAVAFGDFLNDRPKSQSADVGVRLVSRGHSSGETESARDKAAESAFLRKLRGKTPLLHLIPYEPSRKLPAYAGIAEPELVALFASHGWHNREQSNNRVNESVSAPFHAPVGFQLTGLIERVTFFSEESGFCVLHVKGEGHRDLVTVVGSAPAVSAGEWVIAEGDWLVDKQHGRQLKAFHLRTMPPNTREGMEKYLGSGMVKGIGPVYAKKLIARFGEELFGVIEKTPNSLEQVEGIGPKRKLKIIQA